MKRSCQVLVLFCSLGLLAASVVARAGSSDAARPAEWARHNLIVKLHDLPKRYSCDDLWYRFRDILLDIGARPNLEVSTYRCERALGPNARSPRVHLTFDMPRPLPGAQTDESDVLTIAKTVHLAAGQPHSLDATDCELLRQIKGTLLAALSVRVIDFSLDCMAPENARPPFGVSIRTLQPIESGKVHAALSAAVQPFS